MDGIVGNPSPISNTHTDCGPTHWSFLVLMNLNCSLIGFTLLWGNQNSCLMLTHISSTSYYDHFQNLQSFLKEGLIIMNVIFKKKIRKTQWVVPRLVRLVCDFRHWVGPELLRARVLDITYNYTWTNMQIKTWWLFVLMIVISLCRSLNRWR